MANQIPETRRFPAIVRDSPEATGQLNLNDKASVQHSVHSMNASMVQLITSVIIDGSVRRTKTLIILKY